MKPCCRLSSRFLCHLKCRIISSFLLNTLQLHSRQWKCSLLGESMRYVNVRGSIHLLIGHQIMSIKIPIKRFNSLIRESFKNVNSYMFYLYSWRQHRSKALRWRVVASWGRQTDRYINTKIALLCLNLQNNVRKNILIFLGERERKKKIHKKKSHTHYLKLCSLQERLPHSRAELKGFT